MSDMQQQDSISDSECYPVDNVGATQSTQETQQATQIASQSERAVDAHLWGFLIPCSPTLIRIDFSRVRPTYKIGRNPNPAFGNDLIFPGMKISELCFSSVVVVLPSFALGGVRFEHTCID